MARILLVTPDAAFARMTLWILTEEKHEAAAAPDVPQALALFDDFHPDIVLFNGQMSSEKQAGAQRMYEALPGLQIIGVHDGHHADGARHIRAEGHLHKPFHAEDLLGLVNELLLSK
jgi:DNA-binding response OmpR family regulator